MLELSGYKPRKYNSRRDIRERNKPSPGAHLAFPSVLHPILHHPRGIKIWKAAQKVHICPGRGYLHLATSEDNCKSPSEDTMGLDWEDTWLWWDGATSLGLQVLTVLTEKPPKTTGLCLCEKAEGQRGKRNMVKLTLPLNRVYQDMRKSPTAFWSCCIATAALRTFLLMLGVGILPFGQIINDMP